LLRDIVGAAAQVVLGAVAVMGVVVLGAVTRLVVTVAVAESSRCDPLGFGFGSHATRRSLTDAVTLPLMMGWLIPVFEGLQV
jgi:mannose/fructose/N-acetylgalactosamine-specific phosphotransferase system component IID